MEYETLQALLPLKDKGVMRLGLQTITALMERLGHPENTMKTIHVAGTNGKGSTCKMLATILQEAGYRVGLYTSPSIMNFNDRMLINGEEVSDEELYWAAEQIREAVKGTDLVFTEFEMYTALAWLIFKRREVDFVVLEVGMGGRIDATNIITHPAVSVIMKIAMDHTDMLGDSLPKIAMEKAKIIKAGRPVVCYPYQDEEVYPVFEAETKAQGSELIYPDVEALSYDLTLDAKQTFTYQGESYRLNFLEEHQIWNATVVLEVIKQLQKQGIRIDEAAIKAGLDKVTWPARFEWIHHAPDIIIDGSHNLDGIMGLKESMLRYFADAKRIGIMGILADKDTEHIIKEIVPIFDTIITVRSNSDRALTAAALKEQILEYAGEACGKIILADDYQAALDEALQCVKQAGEKQESVVAIFGSFYYVGLMRQMVLEQLKDGLDG